VQSYPCPLSRAVRNAATASLPFHLDAASAGYTMQEQHDVHALVSSGEAENAAPLTKTSEEQEYGANVELF